jgi:hypothetical protein
MRRIPPETATVSAETATVTAETLTVSVVAVTVTAETVTVSSVTVPVTAETPTVSGETVTVSAETATVTAVTLTVSADALSVSVETVAGTTETLTVSSVSVLEDLSERGGGEQPLRPDPALSGSGCPDAGDGRLVETTELADQQPEEEVGLSLLFSFPASFGDELAVPHFHALFEHLSQLLEIPQLWDLAVGATRAAPAPPRSARRPRSAGPSGPGHCRTRSSGPPAAGRRRAAHGGR